MIVTALTRKMLKNRRAARRRLKRTAETPMVPTIPTSWPFPVKS